LNAEAEQKIVNSLALRKDAAGLFNYGAPHYSPVNNNLARDLRENNSLLSQAFSSFERATKSRLQERRTTSDD